MTRKPGKSGGRIRKLLAMAGDASSPNEAAIAAKRAKALLNEHNLSEADVIAGGMTLDDFRRGTWVGPCAASRSGSASWVRRLRSTPAQALFFT